MTVQWIGPGWLETPARWAGLPWYDRVVSLYLSQRLSTQESLAPLVEFEQLHSLSVVAWDRDKANLQAYATSHGVQLVMRPDRFSWIGEIVLTPSEGGDTAETAEEVLSTPPFSCPSGRELAYCTSHLPQPEME